MSKVSPDPRTLDVEAIRQRYEAERVKRLRPAGTDQYNFTVGKFAKFSEDPFATETPARDPVSEKVDVLVIGAGIGGIQLGATLQQQGIENFLILDVASDFGGTWYWNRYPGLRCDVLEPIPRTSVRRRIVHLPAVSRGSGVCAD